MAEKDDSSQELLGEEGALAKLANSKLTIYQNLKNTELDVKVVVVAEEFSIGELITMSLGSVLVFDSPASSEASLTVNGKQIATGDVVEVNGKFGFKVGQLL